MTPEDVEKLHAIFAKRDELLKRTSAALDGWSKEGSLEIVMSWMSVEDIEDMLRHIEKE